MQSDLTYCPDCRRPVRVTWTPAPLHEGEPNLGEAELVCLELGDCCSGGVCPLSNLPRVVMAVRLAKSDLRDGWPTTHLRCVGCGKLAEMKVLDDSHVLCGLCGTTNSWVLLELMEHGRLAVPQEA